MTDLEQLQLDGANAFRLGRSELDNPFYKSAAMPAATGESLEEWQQKLQSWELGYTMEQAIDNPDGKMLNRIIQDISENPA